LLKFNISLFIEGNVRTVKQIHSEVTYHLSVAELLQLTSSQTVSVAN